MKKTNPVLVRWKIKEHHFARWNEKVFCPNCGHHGQWALSFRFREEGTEDGWSPYYRYCPNCLGVYDLPKNYHRHGDPWPKTEGPGDVMDRLLHERKAIELAALEEKLLDGGIEGEG